MKKHIKKELLLKSLEQSLGVVTVACNKVDIPRSTYYKWLKEDKVFAKEVRDIGIPKEIIEDWNNGIYKLEKYKKNKFCLTKKTYVIKNQENGLYKIGCSKKPKYREKTLQAETPNIKMIKIWNKNIENKLHKEYSKYRIRGEWFKLTKLQVHYICNHY
jgi:hypothetical protein